MKKITVLTVMLFTLLNIATVNAQSQIGVVIDGEEIAFTDAVPFADENNRTLVPLRAVVEAMGLIVSWDNEQQKAIFKKSIRGRVLHGIRIMLMMVKIMLISDLKE